jgi:hypothetical protein
VLSSATFVIRCIEKKGETRAAYNRIGRNEKTNEMKKTIVLAFSMVMWMMGNAVWAKTSNETQMDVYEFKFHSNEVEVHLDLGDVTNKTLEELAASIESVFNNPLISNAAELTCKASVTGKVNVGLASVEITVEVSGPCALIAKEGGKIANMVLNEIKKAVQIL